MFIYDLIEQISANETVYSPDSIYMSTKEYLAFKGWTSIPRKLKKKT